MEQVVEAESSLDLVRSSCPPLRLPDSVVAEVGLDGRFLRYFHILMSETLSGRLRLTSWLALGMAVGCTLY